MVVSLLLVGLFLLLMYTTYHVLLCIHNIMCFKAYHGPWYTVFYDQNPVSVFRTETGFWYCKPNFSMEVKNLFLCFSHFFVLFWSAFDLKNWIYFLIFGNKFGFRVPILLKKICMYSLWSGLLAIGILDRKFQPFWVSVSVSGRNPNPGFGHWLVQ